MKKLLYSVCGISILLSLLICCTKKELNSLPVVTITSPLNGAEIQHGITVVISAEAEDEDGSIEEVQFLINGIGRASVSNFPYNYEWNTAEENIGSFSIQATAYDNKGAKSTAEIGISVVINTMHSEADFTATPTIITTGQSVHFIDQSTNSPTSWSWDFGNGGTSASQNPSQTYYLTGTYTVSLTATNYYGSDTETKTNYIIVATSEQNVTVTDYDGYIYNAVKIGTQWWLAENLKSKHYSDGTAIPFVESTSSWDNLDYEDKAYCYYNNNENGEANTYGALYTWAASMNGAESSKNNPSGIQGVCPCGWHLPSDDEWTELVAYLGGENVAGGKMKEAGTDHWKSPNTDATNESGFTALPGGDRGGYGGFDDLSEEAWFWSATKYGNSSAYSRGLDYYFPKVYRYEQFVRVCGFSVRCVKD